MARVQMALCLAATERYAEARTLLEQVASSDAAAPTPPQPSQMRNQPTPENIGRARARYHLAQLDLVEGEYDRARDGFAALAEAAPEDRLANDCLDLALTLSEASLEDSTSLGRYAQYHQALLRRKPEEARAILEQFVANQTASSLHALASFELGKGLVAAGKYEEALQQFAALVVTHPEHRLAPRALEASGDLQLDKLRRREEAMATYERILLEYPDDLFQDDVRKKLLAARTPTPEEDDRATP
jgi:TolA-binding protein